MVDEAEKNIPSAKEKTTIKKDLFQNTMKGGWAEVLQIYKNHPEAHKLKITMSSDTALHIAVSENQEVTVKQLIELIVAQPNGKDALKIQNKEKNTPLHFAAAAGSLPMCELIVDADLLSVDMKNIRGETPSFVAAWHGKKEAFLYLHTKGEKDLRHARRLDGDTILHCTIARDHFDLAFQIIHLYKKMLVDCVNEEGMLPLHLLASKPSAFKSGYQMERWKRIIYNCISVDELKVPDEQLKNEKNLNIEEDVKNQKGLYYTELFKLCVEFFHFCWNWVKAATSFKCKRQTDVENPGGTGHQGSLIGFAKRAFEPMLISTLGPARIRKIKKEKRKHTWAIQIMKELLKQTSMYEDDLLTGRSPQQEAACEEGETEPYNLDDDNQVKFSSDIQQTKHSAEEGDLSQTEEGNDQPSHGEGKAGGGWGVSSPILELPMRDNFIVRLHKMKSEICILIGENIQNHKKLNGKTPLLLAVKYGIIEIVDQILEQFPIAKYDRDEDKKNIVLLATENRQPHVYQLLVQKYIQTENLFQNLDKDGNSALHLAAKLGNYKPWRIPGAALQMQWEFKWYEFVRESLPPHFYPVKNNAGETPKDVFSKTHANLIKEGGEWLCKTSESCSVVAALIATVAFATSSSVPGDFKEKKGIPTLGDKPEFSIFAIAAVLALCFSVMALIMFLAILTSRYQEKDFGKQLPRRLLLGLTSLFVSIASILVSFCAGHFFVLNEKLKYAALPVYASTCLLATYFAVVQFPLYFDVMLATFRKLPQRSHQEVEF